MVYNYITYIYTVSLPHAEVLIAIRDTAFAADDRGRSNDLPVILSLRHDCGWDHQLSLAETLKDTLGDMLVRRGFGVIDDQLPSPSELRGKVLIQGRGPRGKGMTRSELEKLFYLTAADPSALSVDRPVPCTAVLAVDEATSRAHISNTREAAIWEVFNRTHFR
jgi:hypothetical protein